MGEVISFNRPCIVGRELEYIQEAITINWRISGDGPYTHQAQTMLEKIIGAPRVLLTSSCTHALDMTALLLNIQPGDEVILPSFTFVSTANAFVLLGGKPVFVDIRPDTLNINETLIEAAITPRTRAIVVVHYAGVACEMDAINTLAERHNLVVIEDNAHGLFATYKGKNLGTLGDLATQSFHETKNVMCGEGGALVINKLEYVERAEIIREKGTNRSQFFRGMVDKYTWVDVGSSYLVSDFTAAYLVAQLEEYEKVQAKRHRIWKTYDTQLKDWAVRHNIMTPTIPDSCEHPAHLYYLILPSLEARSTLIEYLAARDIVAVFHYQPLHLSKMGHNFGGQTGDCPVTERVADTLVRLPIYYDLSESDQERVVETLLAWTG